MQPMNSPTEPVRTRETVEIARGPFSIRGTLTRPGRTVGVLVRATPTPSLEGAGLMRMAEREGLAMLEIHAVPRSDCPPSADPAREEHEVHRAVQAFLAATDWLRASPLGHVPVGLVATGESATAVLHAAAARPTAVQAIVLIDPVPQRAAADLLARVTAPVLSVTTAEHAERLIPLREHLHQDLQDELILRAADAEDPDTCERVAGWLRPWFHRSSSTRQTSRTSS